jgi:hypothetical protein
MLFIYAAPEPILGVVLLERPDTTQLIKSCATGKKGA